MAITAKELAQKLNLSATAVSMALNNKPGVSTETKNKVIQAAEKYGYDFSRISSRNHKEGSIYAIWYRGNNAVIRYAPIFDELLDGIEKECRRQDYKLRILQFYEKNDDIQKIIETLRLSDCIGIILLGTELKESYGEKFLSLNIPVVILDSYFDSLNCNSVLINNRQGAYLATAYLLSRRLKQPGHLQSSSPLRNFSERKEGFEKALRDNGMTPSLSIVHELPPYIDGALADMLNIIDSGAPLADCYFADNDLIAIGAMKALKLRGYRIPEDVAIVGFDNISECRIIEPSLTSINIPRMYMAELAAQKLIDSINNPIPYTSKIEVSTNLIKRFST
jgi:LacI family transcriptional regulator